MSLTNFDRVLVVIGRTRHKMVVAELDECNRRGCKFIELRLDFLAKAIDFRRLIPHKHCPWVATLRRPQDGGRWPGTEEDRLAVLRQAIVSGFEWVDLEMDIAEKIRRYGACKRIVSYHNMAETPADLEHTYDDMLKLDADVYKIAVMCNKPEDIERIIKMQKSAPKPTVCFGMGEIGLITRYTSLKFGAPWIYAAFNKDRGIAPGLPSLDDFKTTFPVRSINAETDFYGVVGDPVSHSFSPLLHNHMFMRNKVNAFFVPIKLYAGDLPQGLKALETIPMSGYSVTIPHKADAAGIAADADAFVKKSSAANTLVRRPNGTFFAANTDHMAAVDSIKSHLDTIYPDGDAPQLNQLSALILGSGGAARAVAHGLQQEGAHLTISARSNEKAMKLAEEVHCKVIDWAGRGLVHFDILINCTPLGMHPNVDVSPFLPGPLGPGKIVFDTVYTPEQTLLLKEAKSRGASVIPGVDMFVRQASKQFEMFTGVTPDIAKMREIMKKALSPIRRALEDESADARGEKVEEPAADAAAESESDSD